jgi:hypothetical protein
MRWAYGNWLTQDDLIWEKPGYNPQDESPLQCYKARDGPHWNLPPTSPVDEAIASYKMRMERAIRDSISHIQIPVSWSVSSDVSLSL